MRASPGRELPSIYLKPGEAYFSGDPTKVVTILGSCVSVIMYCSARKIGAICHAVMPSPDGLKPRKPSPGDTFQFVDSSVVWMVSQFEKAGIRRSDIEVKIFGGAEIFVGANTGGSVSVGRKNIEAALTTLKEQNMKLKAWNVGGNKGRKVIFYTDTGDVFTKIVKKIDPDAAIPGSGRTV